MQIWWWAAAAFCAFFVKGLCGFANTLVFSTILSFGNNNINISPVELLLGYPTNLIIAWKERKSVKWGVCVPLAILVLIGNIPGILLLKNTDAQIIKIVFGIAVIAIGIEMYFRETRKKKMKESKAILALIGIISGVLCGLYGVGAFLAAYIGRVTDDTKTFKANICMVFIAENTFRIVMYTFMGIITMDILRQAVILIPVMLAGLFAGMKSSSVIDEKIVKKIVIVMLVLSGIALIMNNLS
ncbi:MAG: sulfite exporter TauE/SafE family protein [Clostridia bacterium]|nr:sulfite exporter TauE/SafE family protein [Clostridia bacterium]NCC42262.1 sulfite exporter TauE/SafE family protein [Clostridia bacterium]